VGDRLRSFRCAAERSPAAHGKQVEHCECVFSPVALLLSLLSAHIVCRFQHIFFFLPSHLWPLGGLSLELVRYFLLFYFLSRL
jgi:hypothetical protein